MSKQKNIFEELRTDHEIQRDLLGMIVETSGDSKGRQEMFDKLKVALEDHAKYEERYFYNKLIEHDLTQEKARHSMSEHHDIDEKIEKLEKTDLSSPIWLKTAKDLKELVEHHLDEEEREVFPLAGKVLNQNEKRDLSSEYSEEMKEARNA